ncbi:MAG: hypothetical protein ACLQUY_23315 [Ktedonobacterales bacterium]
MSVWLQLIQEIEDFPREIRELRVSPQVSPEEIRADDISRNCYVHGGAVLRRKGRS